MHGGPPPTLRGWGGGRGYPLKTLSNKNKGLYQKIALRTINITIKWFVKKVILICLIFVLKLLQNGSDRSYKNAKKKFQLTMPPLKPTGFIHWVPWLNMCKGLICGIVSWKKIKLFEVESIITKYYNSWFFKGECFDINFFISFISKRIKNNLKSYSIFNKLSKKV